MNRKITIEAPVDYYSGYSAKARDFVMALITLNYDVEVVNSVWNGYQNGFLVNNAIEPILHRLVKKINKPDIYICIDSPARFFKKGKINIGVTAGIETDRCNPDWIKKLNLMDLVLVPSKHSKDVLINSQTGRKKLKTPIEILFEGANIDVFCNPKRSELSGYLDKIKEKFAFLFVGQWLPADGDNDRKNVSNLVRYFLKTFNGNKDIALLLKTAADDSTVAKVETEDKIEAIIKETGSDAIIYNLHGGFTDEQMSELYHHPKIAAMVSLTRGEGFGRPLLEFSLTGKPIMATNWSGHLDFLPAENAILVDGELKEVHESVINADIIEGAQWMDVNFDDEYLQNTQKNVFWNITSKYDLYKKEAKHLAKKNKECFSLEKMIFELGRIIEEIVNLKRVEG